MSRLQMNNDRRFTFTSGLTVERLPPPNTPVGGLTVVALAKSLDNAASWQPARRDGGRFEPRRRGAATTRWRGLALVSAGNRLYADNTECIAEDRRSRPDPI
jgi:hypothetical protein